MWASGDASAAIGDLFVGCANSATTILVSTTGGGQLDTFTNLYRGVVGIEVDPINEHVYLTGGNYHTICRANFDGSGLLRLDSVTSTNYAGGKAVFGERLDCAIDVSGNRIFITTGGAGQSVGVGSLDGTGGYTTLWNMSHRLNGIEYDPLGDKLYFADLDAGIYVANADGSGSPSLLYAGTEYRHLTLDPAHDMMYWADWSGYRILGAPMSGGSSHAVYSGLSARPYGIDLDPASGDLYWSEVFGGTIYAGNTNGAAPTQISTVYDARGLALLVAPIPEAATVALVGLGLGVVAVRRRSRQRK
ncbi:MAG: PEP-CTERM sorting domain-containing protein [Kiritimatiellae bacterium]|nr:PEP-CTERM sorting domain-containing protein [Kiritimatiellia bacterium]